MSSSPIHRLWPVDEEGRMTYLKIPHSINLDARQEQRGVYSSPHANIASLPPELQCTILFYLPAIDRACLSLTCKSLAASAVASSHLRAGPWTPWLFFDGDPSNNLAGENPFPLRSLLIKRLAHGWTDKKKYRYCQSCERILPRDRDYFKDRLSEGKKNRRRKQLPWNVKCCVAESEWKKWNTKKRHEHILNLWSESERADGSIFSCNPCFERELGIGNGRYDRDRDLEKGVSFEQEGGPLRWLHQVPVECPCCVVKSLSETYKEPRKPKVRPWLWRWTKKGCGCAGNTVLLFVYLLYLLFKVPFDLGLWIYKKCRGSNFRAKMKGSNCFLGCAGGD